MEVDRLRAEVNLNNLLNNYQILKKLYNDKEIFAVVKADAYGHGSKEVSLFLEKNGCNYFAVTELSEALVLREASLKGEILIFGKTSLGNISYIEDYDLLQTIDSYSYAFELNKLNKKIRVHLNIDTGMSRLGILCHENKDIEKAVDEIKKISKLENLEIKGIYTHFSSADTDLDFTNHQREVFDDLIKKLKKEEIDYGLVHIQNSAGVINVESNSYDLARCGITLYGYPPVKTSERFLPVMSLYAKVIAIREITEGDSVSYSRTFIAKEKMTVATVAIGYADGYMRILSNNDFFYYKGYNLPVIGRVCMGLTMINITGVDIREGEFVEVFGMNKSLEDMARRALTITYELLTNMAKPRVKHFYIK
ncbi:MAG: alanine racemase [Candidatus Izemoplasmatales bacterium]